MKSGVNGTWLRSFTVAERLPFPHLKDKMTTERNGAQIDKKFSSSRIPSNDHKTLSKQHPILDMRRMLAVPDVRRIDR